jgi:hypothetical protein
MRAGKIVLLIFGVIVLLISFGLTAIGSTLLWVNARHVDNEGFLTSDTLHTVKSSNAVVIGPIELDEVAISVLRTIGVITVFRFEATNNNASKQIFMGVADQSDLEKYLDNVAYDELKGYNLGWRLNFRRVTYVNHPGTSSPSNPTSAPIWAVSAVGNGPKTLEWQTEAGNNSIVIMNGDGSKGIDLDVIVKAKIPSIAGYGVGLLVAGIILLMGGGLMVFFAVRRV